jgi:hypothetical protein
MLLRIILNDHKLWFDITTYSISQLKITCQHTGVMATVTLVSTCLSNTLLPSVSVILCFHLSLCKSYPLWWIRYVCALTYRQSIIPPQVSLPDNPSTFIDLLYPSVYQISIVSSYRKKLLSLGIIILKDEPLVTFRWLRNYRICMLYVLNNNQYTSYTAPTFKWTRYWEHKL